LSRVARISDGISALHALTATSVLHVLELLKRGGLFNKGFKRYCIVLGHVATI